MNGPEPKIGYLEELKEFLTFLKNLWGILAGLSVFFPLSNVLLGAIPMRAYGTDDGVFDLLSPNLINTIATVVTLFVVLVTFAGRNQFQDAGRRLASLAGMRDDLSPSLVFLPNPIEQSAGKQ